MKIVPPVLAKIRERSKAWGRWEKPSCDPRLPGDLSNLNDAQLGKLWTEYSAMVQWAKGVCANAEVEAAEVKRREKIVRAKAFLSAEGSREERAAQVETDPEVQRLSGEVMTLDGIATLATALFDGYMIGKDAVSRELTRRIALEQGRGSSGDAPRGRFGHGKPVGR